MEPFLALIRSVFAFGTQLQIRTTTILYTTLCTLVGAPAFAQSSDTAKTIPIVSYLLLEEPEISILSNTVVSEGDSGTQTVNLRVAVSPYADSSVDVEIVPNGSAQQGSDYNAPTLSRITFANGVDEAILSFEIIGDAIDETAESFTVRLFDPTEVELSSRDTATITIIDDESLYNDTGIQIAGEAVGGLSTNCTSPNVISQQDCANGRDAKASARTLAKLGGGVAGFDFTKLGADGQPLQVQTGTYSANGSEVAGTIWSCVRDNHTGLVWEVKTIGGVRDKDIEYQWGGLTAIGRDHLQREGTYYDSWNPLVNNANSGSGLCGRTDWRVPSLKALSTIVNYGQPVDFRNEPPMIDLNFFPNTVEGGYWTSLPEAGSPGNAWEIDFNNGTGGDSSPPRNLSNRVRLVSGAHEAVSTEVPVAIGNQEVYVYIDNTTPNNRYEIAPNSLTVVDQYTGLMWQRCQLGLSGSDCTTGTLGVYTWNQALQLAQSNTLAGYDDWRVPNLAELRTLNAYDRINPAINSFAFPNTQDYTQFAPSTVNFTSSPALSSTSNNTTWTINSFSGSDARGIRTTNLRSVRLVRGGID